MFSGNHHPSDGDGAWRMKAVAAGDFSCKTTVLYSDEIGQLNDYSYYDDPAKAGDSRRKVPLRSPLRQASPGAHTIAAMAGAMIGTLVGKRQFGLIRVTGPGNDRRIELSSRDQSGTELWRHAMRVSDIAYPRHGGGAP